VNQYKYTLMYTCKASGVSASYEYMAFAFGDSERGRASCCNRRRTRADGLGGVMTWADDQRPLPVQVHDVGQATEAEHVTGHVPAIKVPY
jgi:hypothetical protein